ncbi:UDP-N-acetylmuramoyl-L-alanyl-D-glutamate--2,6-diaminopimelate ligase [Massilia sp. PWRC2]|uniref:UDP-N-acetylmuramoyl-L-alanyl-D-glutamate--2, 6-diaminopimelate ligase n=1 Tax=Massilia sp. PWRC2 TaxID=2804626 RepID=UPI003CF2C5EF
MTPIDIAAWIANAAPQGRLATDSRLLQPGDVFFAYPGDAVDGRQFIDSAVERGAAAVLFDPDHFVANAALRVPQLAVPALKANAGPIAHALRHQPDRAMFSVGVTGTNGKTSVALWLGQALSRLGQNAAVIGTLGVGLFNAHAKGAAQFDVTGYTTPDAVMLAERLAGLRDAGATALAIEVSSIGLVQGRTRGMHFDVAVFTNLTRDHLDFHGDMASYEAAKVTLFEWPGLQAAVINLDDAAGLRLVQHLRTHGPQLALTGYTLQDAGALADIDGVTMLRAAQCRSKHGGTEFQLTTALGNATVKTALVGHFNISNALAVLGTLLVKQVALKAAVDAVEALTPAPGRMQQVDGQGSVDGPLVIVDYAHTPDALEKTLAALKQVAHQRGGELWCVFGCGGDRDPGKRAPMGAIAQIAEHVFVTSDNPRSEEPAAIIADIVKGIDPARAGSSLHTIEDRAAAILLAIKQAARPDVILLAGKGHEPYQEIKGRKLAFSDFDHASLALTARATMLRGS